MDLLFLDVEQKREIALTFIMFNFKMLFALSAALLKPCLIYNLDDFSPAVLKVQPNVKQMHRC